MKGICKNSLTPSKDQTRESWLLNKPLKLRQFMATKTPLQEILQGILNREDKSKQNHERTGSIIPLEKKRQGIREQH
jgi:hypothetical protein